MTVLRDEGSMPHCEIPAHTCTKPLHFLLPGMFAHVQDSRCSEAGSSTLSVARRHSFQALEVEVIEIRYGIRLRPNPDLASEEGIFIQIEDLSLIVEHP